MIPAPFALDRPCVHGEPPVAPPAIRPRVAGFRTCLMVLTDPPQQEQSNGFLDSTQATRPVKRLQRAQRPKASQRSVPGGRHPIDSVLEVRNARSRVGPA